MLSPLVTAPLSSPALLIPSTLSQAEAPGQDYVCPCPLLHNSPYRSGQAMRSERTNVAALQAELGLGKRWSNNNGEICHLTESWDAVLSSVAQWQNFGVLKGVLNC